MTWGYEVMLIQKNVDTDWYSEILKIKITLANERLNTKCDEKQSVEFPVDYFD